MNAQQFFLAVLTIGLMIMPDTGISQLVLPYHIMAKRVNQDLYIRWEPSSLAEWQAAQQSGYHIELLDATGQVLQNLQVRQEDPQSYSNGIRNSNPELTGYFDACMSLLYPNKSGSGNEINAILDQMIQHTPQTIDSFKLSMLSFYSSYDMRIAEANGLGIVIRNASPAVQRCRMRVNDNKPILTQVLTNQGITIPSVIGIWGDRKVRLEWNVEELYRQYMGYRIERSADGEKFFALHDLPILDPAVGVDGNKEGTVIGYEDSLSVNYKDFYYRLKTVDYFGLVSTASSMIKGYGFEGIRSSAHIIFADQAEGNKAQLKWTIDDAEVEKIKSLVIMHSNQMDANYTPVDTLDKYTREAKVPMAYDVNYYRVDILPIDGEQVASFPVFVMGLDTIPPAIPAVIGGFIDTMGRIVLQWHPNAEPDLWGYRVFSANFGTDEYALQNATPMKDTLFMDSVSLRLGTKHVYYVLQAVDKRNNRSGFTEPIILAKPDIIPPSSPIVQKAEQAGDVVHVYWSPSGSDDVVRYELYRRRLDADEKWRLLMIVDTSFTGHVTDTAVQYGQRFSYSMRAIDDEGLLSDMAPMKTVVIVKPKAIFLPDIKTNIQFNATDKTVTLDWTSNDSDRVSSVMVYRGWTEDQLGKYKYGNLDDSSFTEPMQGPAEVFYKLRIAYEDDPTPYYSETLHISIPKSND